ncbi:hypothetical protein [Streptomyces kanamyceticus]|uniref:hypothetical protein n=1 Tax=Streptomyces kanamyceticus TaxID=1967 RepID=UPI0037DC1C8B
MRELADRLRDGAESGELEAGLEHESIARECAALDAGRHAAATGITASTCEPA